LRHPAAGPQPGAQRLAPGIPDTSRPTPAQIVELITDRLDVTGGRLRDASDDPNFGPLDTAAG